MTAESAVLAGREAAARQMIDACTVTRENKDADPDPLGHQPRAEVYSGRCKVQTWEAQEARPESAEFEYTVQRYYVHVPVGSYAPAVGDVVRIDAARMDPNLTGREFRVVALLHKSLATAYRLAVTNGPN